MVERGPVKLCEKFESYYHEYKADEFLASISDIINGASSARIVLGGVAMSYGKLTRMDQSDCYTIYLKYFYHCIMHCK